jgi:Asp-tRNA(Asn)/Glu-tRNA(Gln) amidotransferase A subunit family amidase
MRFRSRSAVDAAVGPEDDPARELRLGAARPAGEEGTPILEISTASGSKAPTDPETKDSDSTAYNLTMKRDGGSVRRLRQALAEGAATPSSLAAEALSRSNGNASRNTYLWQDAEWTRREALRAEAMPRADGGQFGDGRSPLWGLPISVKDCFDLEGAPTSCGVEFYRRFNGFATRDSWLAERLRAAGAVITGKTHLHPLAYGITGENREFGDCLQPDDSTALTGGSSSGAAASVQEGSAGIAIGTDTGGSIRVPAALCGVAGYRASIGRGNWRGGAHLSQSFDTMGCLFADLADAPLMAGLFGPKEKAGPNEFKKFAVVNAEHLDDCEPEINASLEESIHTLESLGLVGTRIDCSWWADCFSIFAPIQAWEAARIHAGHFAQFDAGLRERLEWGAGIGEDEIAALRARHEAFRGRVDELQREHELLVLPASPVAKLAAGANHSETRVRLLRYTVPFSLAGVPVVTVPCLAGGVQLAAARGGDEALLQFAARLAGMPAFVA